MIDPLVPLRDRLRTATRLALGDAADADPALHRSQHADYQADLALALGRKLKKNPREVAAAIAANLAADDVIAGVEVSGPGFLNLTLRTDYLAALLGRMRADARLGVARAATPETVVIDYSGPNVAKEMHVGHLRSTIIGDSIARLLEWQGHKVIRRNHVGDWGTPFGMLIEHLLDESAGTQAGVRELGAFYRAARTKFDGDAAFADRARRRVVLLQSGDAETLGYWQRLIDVSVEHFSRLYAALGVTLRPEDVVGESRYNAALPEVVEELTRKGLAVESEGAICVFPPGFTGREGEPVPLIIRKQEGGYGYATTDLAALRQRVRELGARRLLYVVGAPQQQHLAMVFAVARLAGWADDSVRLEHVAFGSVLGPDKKMLKTRAGESVSLATLVEEAVARAAKVVGEKSPDLPVAEQARIASAVGVGAVKYADLSSDRIKDYVFDWNRMLSFEGNTAPYLMYAHARIRSILRKAHEADDERATPGAFALAAPQERALALALVQLEGTLERAAEGCHPNRTCAFLYDVASAFTSFYEACPVLKADGPTRASRLALCAVSARTLALGLDLLGISAPDQM
ncbi:MAG TPA: arginine--tRNA ligase [Polyangia bacterium]|jgi:arginyl-tRNA synthetase|nr:arginine--tRNA ligase [Polyangia bacterium]